MVLSLVTEQIAKACDEVGQEIDLPPTLDAAVRSAGAVLHEAGCAGDGLFNKMSYGFAVAPAYAIGIAHAATNALGGEKGVGDDAEPDIFASNAPEYNVTLKEPSAPAIDETEKAALVETMHWQTVAEQIGEQLYTARLENPLAAKGFGLVDAQDIESQPALADAAREFMAAKQQAAAHAIA